MHRKSRGFTLYEIAITFVLVAVFAGLAAGSFSGIAARHRISTEIDALFHAIYRARSESIMRRRVVSICPSLDGATCTPGRDWSAGWILFDNRDRDEPPQVDAGEPVLQVHRTGNRVRISANRRGFTLRATRLRATNGTIVICDPASRVPAKALVVSYTGRPRVAFETARGEPYRCAD